MLATQGSISIPECAALSDRMRTAGLFPPGAGIDFPQRARQTRAPIDKGDSTIDETSPFCFACAALYPADCVERKEVIMVRFVRLFAAAVLAAFASLRPPIFCLRAQGLRPSRREGYAGRRPPAAGSPRSSFASGFVQTRFAWLAVLAGG